MSHGCVSGGRAYFLAMLFDRSGATYVGNLGPVPLYIHPSAFFLLILAYMFAPGADIPTYIIFVVILVKGSSSMKWAMALWRAPLGHTG